MLDIDPLQEEPRPLGDTFPDQMLHVMGAEHHQGLGVFPDGLRIGRHEQGLQLDDIIGVLLQDFDESVGEIFGDETLHVVGLAREQVGEGRQGLDAQVDVDQLDARLLAVVLGDILKGDVVFLAVDGKDLDLPWLTCR